MQDHARLAFSEGLKFICMEDMFGYDIPDVMFIMTDA